MGGRVISRASRLEAQTTFQPNDGRETGYGYGWAIGKPYEYEKISMPDDMLRSYQGVYTSEYDNDRIITFSEGKLYSMRTGGSRYEIFPFETDKFFFEEGISTLHFLRAPDNSIRSVILKGTGADLEWVRTDLPIPEKKEIQLDESTKMKYTGEYEFTPDFHIHIIFMEDLLYAQATGQEKIEIRPFEPDRFFLVDVDAQLTFNLDDQGNVVSLTLHQNGEHEAKKLE